MVELVNRVSALRELLRVSSVRVLTGTEDKSCTSHMSRLRLQVISEDDKENKDMCLLVKSSVLDHTHEDMDNEVLIEASQLTTEIKVYTEVLPSLEVLMTKMNIADAPLWANCIGHFDNAALVLEDLQELGYRTTDRLRGLDFAHTVLAVRALARFHALTAVLASCSALSEQDFSKFVFSGNYEAVNGFITSSFEYLHRVASRDWSPEWKDIIDKVGRIPEMAIEKLQSISSVEKEGCLEVLNHGDPWVNNMMFRYDNNGQPESIRFVDFQLSHFNSFAFDLHYFTSTSLSPEVLHHLDRVFDEYHGSVCSELARLGQAQLAPSRAALEAELLRTEFFSLFSAVAIAPVIAAPEDIAPPRDNSGYSLAELERRKEGRYRTPDYTRRIQVILRRAEHGGLFKRLFL